LDASDPSARPKPARDNCFRTISAVCPGANVTSSLHAFEFSRIAPPSAAPMSQRGRIDHFALNVPDAETFDQLRTKRLARGSTDGTVTDFGVMRVLTFRDPDGHSVELAHWIGGRGPGEIDMSAADDEERTAQRTAASTELPL
jgi:catechol 2,3-dioxygenase-like lactoylglutathione lyase family enzyme